ncbi:MAG: roadblock/LC7 domain-containing protein [Myxococcaceae bacterium]|nr:roadblock/LC7 domain-containing protein [Myxococcaceae bacterium]
MNSPMVIYEDEFKQMADVCERLRMDANAKAVFLIDKNGQLILTTGKHEHLDTTALASLTAGNIAATDGLAKLIGEREFSILFHEGERDSLHISLVASQIILVVMFGDETSVGLVRLRVRKATDELVKIVQSLLDKTQNPGANSPFAEISDDDLDILFS